MTHQEYKDRPVRWVGDAPEQEALEHRGVLMWGVWFDLTNETAELVATFGTKEAAEGYAALQADRWHVGPCIMDIRTRNNVDIPARTP